MKRLNPAQDRAVRHPGGPLLVLAGAGSGKTLVLTERMARLVREGAARPWEILAVTFTNKAARSLRERLCGILWPRMTPEEVAKEARGLWIGTFHSFCARMLRMEAGKLPSPYGPGFSIFDEDDQTRAMREVLAHLEIDTDDLSPRTALSAVSRAKNAGKGPERVAQEARNFRDEAVAEVYERYQAHLERLNALDYDDLLVLAGRLLAEREDVRAYWQTRFKHVLVDEYQDTNLAQYRLVTALAAQHRNLTVVGDVDQSIYSWRAADFRIILRFEQDYPDAARVTLEENYRSRRPILEVANSVIAHNVERYPKNLRPTRPGDDPVVLHCAADERDEAWWAVERILEFRAQGRGLDDFAILYRTNAQSRVFEEALGIRGIPYRLVGGVKFFDRKEIKDVVAYLRLLVNPRDDVAFWRIVNVPRRGIGGTTLNRLRDNAATAGLSLMAAVESAAFAGIGAAAARKLAEFGSLMAALGSEVQHLTPEQVIRRVLEESAYLAALAKDDSEEGHARVENVRELLTRAAEMLEVGEAVTLDEFLNSVPLQGADDAPAEVGDASAGRVTLMTLHSAKGLEYPVVLLTGLEEGVLPHIRSLGEPEAEEEERRLCYVGITRAADRLFLSHTEARHLAGQFRRNLPSRFLSEIPRHLVERTESPALARYLKAREALNEREAAVRWARFENDLEDRRRQVSEADLVWTQDFDAEPPAFAVGDRVAHPKFGPGEVAEVMTDRRGVVTLAIAFDDAGRKILDPKFAALTRL
ncbi:MAG: UvrD-helicase domain-containing protein [Candidatus Sericytochromatia bacterium]|nr:UvrD-helicase domain-containing protein [Candidatus Tanganyikabacteria bacterium]